MPFALDYRLRRLHYNRNGRAGTSAVGSTASPSIDRRVIKTSIAGMESGLRICDTEFEKALNL